MQRRNVVYDTEAELSGDDDIESEYHSSQDTAGSLRDFIAPEFDNTPMGILLRSLDPNDTVLDEAAQRPEVFSVDRVLSPVSVTNISTPPPCLNRCVSSRLYSHASALGADRISRQTTTPEAVVELLSDDDELDVIDDKTKRVRRFVFTLNNYTPLEVDYLKTLPNEQFKFIFFGFEIAPSTGTPHLQGYLEMVNKENYKSLHNKITNHQGFPSRYGFKIAKGTAEQCIKYCSKDKQTWSRGNVPKGQGKRTDLDAVSEMVMNGSSLVQIARTYPRSIILHSRGIQSLISVLNGTPRSSMTKGYWVFGPTGSGKSRWAHSLSPESCYVKNPCTKWFCGYNFQETVVIDDFRPNSDLSFSFLLRIADRYPMQVETKGGSIEFNSKRVVVTSPLSIDDAFKHLDWMREGELAQLKRRFKELEFGEGKLSHLLRLEDVD